MHSSSNVEFIVTNDPDNDFDLMREAWIGDEQVADVRNINGNWQVTFFPFKDNDCEMTWDTFEKIFQAFSNFISENSKGEN